MQWDRFLEVVSALNRAQVDYVVIGAVALGLHGHPRGTRDLDLFVRPMDILTRLGEAFGYEDLEQTTVDVDGVCVRVVTPQTLHRMKKDTVRPQDRADPHWLADRYGLQED